ncbi:serine/threonine-protein phosphatase [Streptomyces sp. RB6PN25]|uniref:Serine/threonine-protein phosphatase n=1 Tax=Streptomyces humicola TaxID=2953240 RepID=A0ABT1PRS7_9ACTN|nr:PP2C family protein-serine/threonine phosphatase [Streptomyces humicola]MCQ4080368.1 serine/threonine-protein phosphatase [Streptomyces humicola]
MRNHRRVDLRGSIQPGHALLAIPLVLIAVIATADILSPPDIHLGPLLIVAPAFTAAFSGPRITGLIALFAVAGLAMIGVERDVFYTENIQVQIASLVLISALLVVFCQVRERRTRELRRIRAVSEAAHKVVMRPLPERLGPLLIASRYRAADAAAADTQIGGDLYAVARTAGSTRLIIGDVKGKGIASISDTALLLGAFRAAAHRQAPLAELVVYLEGSVAWGLAEFGAAENAEEDQDIGERFVTAAVLDIPDDRSVIHMISCGHPPPLLLRHGRASTLKVRRAAPPLGLGELCNPVYEPTTFDFAPGDLLLLYTDGVSEARDANRDFYPLTERAARWSGGGPDRLLQHLADDLAVHVGGPMDDDVAMIALERGPVELPALYAVSAWPRPG